jgi:hypothetical protein
LPYFAAYGIPGFRQTTTWPSPIDHAIRSTLAVADTL